MIETLDALDRSLFLWFNALHHPWADSLMWVVSGTKTWIPLYLVVLFFIIRQQRWYGLLTLVFAVLVIVAADQASVKLFKDVFERLRPTHQPAIADLVHTVNNYRGGRYGFVSSHAANTFGFATFTLLFFRLRHYTLAILLWASLVSYSRIYLGVHYPGDILGGALLGAVLGWLMYTLNGLAHKKIRATRKQNPSISV